MPAKPLGIDLDDFKLRFQAIQFCDRTLGRPRDRTREDPFKRNMLWRANSTQTYCEKNQTQTVVFKQECKFYTANARDLQATSVEAGNVYLMTAYL